MKISIGRLSPVPIFFLNLSNYEQLNIEHMFDKTKGEKIYNLPLPFENIKKLTQLVCQSYIKTYKLK